MEGAVDTGNLVQLQLLQLPADHVLVGCTQLSLEDIRSFNNVQQVQYELHKNDCRQGSSAPFELSIKAQAFESIPRCLLPC